MRKDATRCDESAEDISLPAAFWKLFCSMKTAIVLLLLLISASVIGTLITQQSSPEMYIRIYGEQKYHILQMLGLTDVYHSAWYATLLALIGINLTACSINRFGSTWRRTFEPTVTSTSRIVETMTRSEVYQTASSVEDAAATAGTVLHSHSYFLQEERSGEDVYLYAAKGRLGIWGPYLTHLSLLVIFAGAIVGNIFGIEGFTIIPEGGSTNTYWPKSAMDRGILQEKNLGFRVGLDRFKIECDREHNPTSYKSELWISNSGLPIVSRVIDVNHPLSCNGVTFLQADYGLSELVMRVTAPNGETKTIPFKIDTQDVSGGKTYELKDDPFKQVRLAGKSLTILIHDFSPDFVGEPEINRTFMPLNPAVRLIANDRFPEYKGLDAWEKLDWLPVSHAVEFKGFTIKFEKAVKYTGLQVSANPGLPIVYTGFVLLVLGVFISFYVPFKVVRIHISPSKYGATICAGTQSRGDCTAFDSEFDALQNVFNDDKTGSRSTTVKGTDK